MRTSILSRSAIALASLAIGSVGLAAAPANAAPTASITRDQVLSITSGLRAGGTQADAAENALGQIAGAHCPFDGATGIEHGNVELISDPSNIDGFLVSFDAYTQTGSNSTYVGCTFAAYATVDASQTLAGDVSLQVRTQGDSPQTVGTDTHQTMSGNAFLTTSVDQEVFIDGPGTTISAVTTGSTVKSTTTTTTTTTKVKRTSAQKKAAKKSYSKKVKAAKKSYTKALDKAGTSKAKKKAAKAKYSKKLASAKKTYRLAIADRTVKVKKTTTATKSAAALTTLTVTPYYI